MPGAVARLIELENGERRRVHALAPGDYVVGREGDVDLRIDHADVSRRHARLRITPEGGEIHDLGSKNGIRVDGRAVVEAPLSDGAQLRLGELVLVFERTRIEELLARSQEVTALRPRAPVVEAGPATDSAAAPSLLGPALAAAVFAALLIVLLVFG